MPRRVTYAANEELKVRLTGPQRQFLQARATEQQLTFCEVLRAVVQKELDGERYLDTSMELRLTKEGHIEILFPASFPRHLRDALKTSLVLHLGDVRRWLESLQQKTGVILPP